ASGKVIDLINDEEYAPLRNENMTGAFVGKVREEYENILSDICDKCCDTVLFASDQANRITEEILKKYDVAPDFPWEQSRFQSYGTFRHSDSRKWFALIMNIKWDALLKNKNSDTTDVINLKINPENSGKLTENPGIYPGYHMNHRNWVSVVLNDTLSDDAVMKLVDTSFSLT
ncbi:MAG: MmcQ/YjbR family DNA-binding protein, partial [Clostridia bacterium]|nr:MmcQ/YjbR family DNA-binding protein [Clostridia bacterium]